MYYLYKNALFPKFSQKKRQLYGGYILTARISPCVFSSKLTKVYHKVMLIASTNLFFFASYNLFYIFLVLVGELRYLCGCKTVIVHIYNNLCLTFSNAFCHTLFFDSLTQITHDIHIPSKLLLHGNIIFMFHYAQLLICRKFRR